MKFKDLIKNKKFNDKLYGNKKYGYRIYINGEEFQLDAQQTKDALIWKEREDNNIKIRQEIRKIDEIIDAIERELPSTIKRQERRIKEDGVDDVIVIKTQERIDDQIKELDKLYNDRDDLLKQIKK